MAKRAFILLLDSFGIGALPDADKFGDVGSDTLGHIAEECAAGRADRAGVRSGKLNIPQMEQLGLGAARTRKANFSASGAYGSAREISWGKDTSSGHWEMMGAPVEFDWGYFPEAPSFTPEIIERLCSEGKIPGILGNCHASGTEIIARLGDEQVKTGKPICYTSADSVFQIAAHEESFGLERLYELCKIAFEILKPYRICRVIARPFVGEKGHYQRTENRRDFSVMPPRPTLLNDLVAAGKEVIAVGKIADIFAHSGISRHVAAHGHEEIFAAVRAAQAEVTAVDSLVFANFVDFDMKYGHRRDVVGYAAALEAFDRELQSFLPLLSVDDLVIVTADHGCDPIFKGSDHTRERIPILIAGPRVKAGCYLGERATYADIGQSLASYFGIAPLAYGESFLDQLLVR